MKKKFAIENLTFPIMGVIILIGITIFLFSGDSGQTGWQTLGLQGGAFWFVAVLCTLVAAYLGYRLYVGNKKETWSPGVKWSVLIIILILLCSPWGRACTDKTNGGVTAPGYKSTAP